MLDRFEELPDTINKEEVNQSIRCFQESDRCALYADKQSD